MRRMFTRRSSKIFAFPLFVLAGFIGPSFPEGVFGNMGRSGALFSPSDVAAGTRDVVEGISGDVARLAKLYSEVHRKGLKPRDAIERAARIISYATTEEIFAAVLSLTDRSSRYRFNEDLIREVVKSGEASPKKVLDGDVVDLSDVRGKKGDIGVIYRMLLERFIAMEGGKIDAERHLKQEGLRLAVAIGGMDRVGVWKSLNKLALLAKWQFKSSGRRLCR